MTLPLTQIAIDAGCCFSGWHQLGDGPWSGTVTTGDGAELTVEQLASSWKVTDETGKTSSGKELGQLLKKTVKTASTTTVKTATTTRKKQVKRP